MNGSPGTNSLDIINNFNQIKKEKTNQILIIVIIHGGNEYFNLPSPKCKKTYRFYAKTRTDLIVGHHPHCIRVMNYIITFQFFYSLEIFIY